MAMVMFAATSFAVNFKSVSGMEFIPGAKEMIQQNISDFNNKVLSDDASLISRSSVDNNGVVWEARLLSYGPNWHQYFSNEDGSGHMEFEECPFYEVLAATYCFDEAGDTYNMYQAVLFWPSRYLLGLSDDSTYEGAEPATIDELIESGYNTFITMEEGYINMYDKTHFGMINSYWFDVPSLFKGVYGYIDAGTQLTVSNYIKNDSAIDLQWSGTWTEDGAASSSGAFATKFSGTAFISGFEPVIFNGDFTELHIYNFGQVDWDTYPGDLYEEDFEPVRLYKVFAHNDKIEVRTDETGVPVGFVYKDETAQSSDATYFIGSAYANLDATSPVGEYVVQELDRDYQTGYIYNVPTEGTMIPGIYSQFPMFAYDGISLIYHGNSYDPTPGSVMSIKNDSFSFKGTDTYSNTWDINWEKCYIHNDPSDYSIVEELTSGINRLFGDKTANLITKSNGQINVTAAENGVIAVYSTTGTLVKTVKAVAGQEVSIDLGHGLYIVRVGKTASKVIL